MTTNDRERASWSAVDERPHQPEAAADWRETWEFWFWSPAGRTGGYTGLTIVDGGRRSWYWAALVRPNEPLLHVCELDGPALRPSASLLLKSAGLWADHDCESPFEQWTVANECYAVALDDPDEVFGRAYGVATPIAFDLEWYASSEPLPVAGGYEQIGTIHAVIEVPGGPIHDEFLSRRTHRWGAWPWGSDELSTDGRRAPLLVDGERIERVLTERGWAERQA